MKLATNKLEEVPPVDSSPSRPGSFESLVRPAQGPIATRGGQMNGVPIRVLLLEDNPGDAGLVRAMLNEPGAYKTELTHFEYMKDTLNHLATNAVSVILIDLGLPDANGLGALRQVHAAAPSVPMVVLTGLDDESVAIQALQEGAQDYLIKGKIQSHALLRTLRYAIERQRLQLETDQARRMQLQIKDDFLSHVSHELRSPLTAIHHFGTILADELVGEVSADQRECLEIILKNISQLESMIGDLLEVTRAQEGKLAIDPQCASIPDAVVNAIKTIQGVAEAKGIVLSFEPSPTLPLVYADPTRLHQILIILLDNAIKFTGSAGVVKVRVRVPVEDPAYLLVEVTDSGCGIRPDMTERVFERLYQVTDHSEGGRKGLGLGLYICKELVTRQGGRIWVTSSPQKGSTFSFTLPAFSLSRLLSPLLKNKKWPVDSVALITVEIRSPGGSFPRETREKWYRDARNLLQKCLLPNLDVLLPKMGSRPAR